MADGRHFEPGRLEFWAPVVNELGLSPESVPAIIPFNFPAAEVEIMRKIALVAELDPDYVELTRADSGLLRFQVGHDGPPSPSRLGRTPPPNIEALADPVAVARFEPNHEDYGPAWRLVGVNPGNVDALMIVTSSLMTRLYNRQKRANNP